ncbi:flagellin [Tindallia magadiensis]|uniref:Flagellin n=1 Tax=Tindallia magadiensis TaxID=69895 RepID=A0A1I3C6J6_9FIRM|nr:flagellin [Tindallia magadiensis]SFH70205.1 flagellin [Tindallia magadiensis]
MRIDASMNRIFEQMSSGQRINRAGDDAAGLSISEQMRSQIRGTDMGTRNTQDMQNLANTAEGAMNSIHNDLQRIRELAVKASSGIMTDSDRKTIQQEVEQLRNNIGDTVRNTEFNQIRLLDGSFQDKNIASSPRGTGIAMTIENTGLEALGIADFDVTGNFDISILDNAIQRVSSARSDLGAMTNRMDSTIANNQVSSENQTAAESRIRDADMAAMINQLNQQQLIQQYQIQVKSMQMNQMGMVQNILL